MAQPSLLDYGSVGTRFGVVCDERPDGGVTITIPPQRFLRIHFGSGIPLPLVILYTIFGPRVRYASSAHRAVIELTPQALTIRDNPPESIGAESSRTWPRHEIAELRQNRYSPGIYVRIAGKANFDILADLHPSLLKWLGDVFEKALARLREEVRPPYG
jgi:hypothetical protein